MLDFLCLFGITWTSAFEQTPADTDSPGEGDDRIREGKVETRSRADQEHFWLGTASTGETIHRAGTARAYYQTTAPTLRPDAVTALGASDDGRLLINSTTKDTSVWTGSAWSGVGMNTIVDQGGGTHLKTKIVEIGDWNMYSTASVTIAHGLTLSTIRAFAVIIRNDADTVRSAIFRASGGTSNGDANIDATNVNISRVASGLFDTTDYNSTSYNRGYIYIWYAEA